MNTNPFRGVFTPHQNDYSYIIKLYRRGFLMDELALRTQVGVEYRGKNITADVSKDLVSFIDIGMELE